MTSGRLLAAVRDDGRPVLLEEHMARYGPLRSDRDLIGAAAASGLTGRGGGAFPTGRKLQAVAGERGRPVVVVNGAEGEPASKKDKALLGAVPHLVLDGAIAAASALGAREVVVAVSREARAERSVLAAALNERRDRVRWRLAAVPDGFVSGEETALLSSLAGGGGKPAVKPPQPFERGLGGAPTLVQNVETLAQLGLIARYGAEWFRSVGTEREPGTALVTLSGSVARPGVYELELGTTIAELVARAGGATEPVEAFLVGGYFGAWTRDSELSLSAANGLAAGVVVAFPASACPLRESARVARYLADESAGQCGPCVHGLAALAQGLEQLAGGNREDRHRLARWADEVAGRGACRHPDGAAAFISSTLAVFEGEIEKHLSGSCKRRDRGILPVA
jgi:NADH:ubiquinone oxidoreductase subunit F (NADH-binding)